MPEKPQLDLSVSEAESLCHALRTAQRHVNIFWPGWQEWNRLEKKLEAYADRRKEHLLDDAGASS